MCILSFILLFYKTDLRDFIRVYRDKGMNLNETYTKYREH